MKMITRYSIVALIFINCKFVSQSKANFLGHYIHFTPKTRPLVNFNEQALSNELFKKYSPIVKKKSELDEFISLLVEGKKHYLYSNTEYEKLDSAVLYLENIVAKIYSATDLPLKIRIVRDPSLNACAFEDGTVYINVGLLARYKNEAELAATLGHEIGHVVKQHSYNSYKAQKQYFKSVYYGSLSTNKSLFSTLIQTKSSSNKLVGQEQESDDFSIELLKASNYNTLALYSEQKIYLELENKYKKLKEYKENNSLFYLKTHPSSESRLNKASKVETNGGRNFLVDSVFFMRLKQQAIDETINLYFEEQDFDRCIEMAFVQHLKFPEDSFYLFYLTEATRRLTEYNKNYKNAAFISGIYKKEFMPEKIAAEKVFVISNGQVKPVKKGDLNSILFKLTGPILQTDSSDLQKFKNARLLKNDTLAFDTYSDALDYFKSINVYGNYFLNNSFSGDTCGNSSESEYENEFCELPENIRQYYSRSLSNKKVLFVIYNVAHVVSDNGMFGSNNITLLHNTSENLYGEVRRNDKKQKVSTGHELSFREISSLLNYLDLVYPLIKNKEEKTMSVKSAFQALNGNFNPNNLITRDTASFNYSRITPELVKILNKYGYKGVVFTSVYISDETKQGVYGSGAKYEKWTIKHFFLDVPNNKVKFYLSPNCVNFYSEFSFGNSTNTYNGDLYKCFYDTIIDATQ